MTTDPRPYTEVLDGERSTLLAESRFTQDELEERNERWMLTPPEGRLLLRLYEIRWLLEEGD